MKSGSKAHVMDDSIALPSNLNTELKAPRYTVWSHSVSPCFHMTFHITEAGVNFGMCGSNWRFAVWVVICWKCSITCP